MASFNNNKEMDVAENDPDALFATGMRYYNGEFGASPENLSKAARYFKMAADQGHPDAQYHYSGCLSLGFGVKKNPSEAAKYVKLAADQGNVNSQYNYAMFLRKGEGVAKNLSDAARYFKMAADRGDASAQYEYAVWIMKEQTVGGTCPKC